MGKKKGVKLKNSCTSSTRSALGIFFTTSGEKVLYLNSKDWKKSTKTINTFELFCKTIHFISNGT